MSAVGQLHLSHDYMVLQIVKIMSLGAENAYSAAFSSVYSDFPRFLNGLKERREISEH